MIGLGLPLPAPFPASGSPSDFKTIRHILKKERTHLGSFLFSFNSMTRQYLKNISVLFDIFFCTAYNLPEHPGVAQLEARMVWDHEAVGSNPTTRTSKLNFGRWFDEQTRRIKKAAHLN